MWLYCYERSVTKTWMIIAIHHRPRNEKVIHTHSKVKTIIIDVDSLHSLIYLYSLWDIDRFHS